MSDVKARSALEEYLSLPEGHPAQLIEGEIIVSPSPSYKHQKICGLIFWKMMNLCQEKDIGEVLYEFDVHLDDENVIRPDIVFVSKENKERIKERWVNGAPDLVVEVVSPSSATMDTLVKKDLYEKFGVKEYWIIDVEGEEIFVYTNEGGKFVLACRGKKCESKTMKGFSWGFGNG